MPTESSAWLGLNDVRGSEVPMSWRFLSLVPSHPSLHMGGPIDLGDRGGRRLLELMGVRIDGQPAASMAVNLAQVGVWLEAGRHTVEFSFRPRGVLLGGTLSVAGLAVMCALTVIVWTSRTTGPAGG